MKDHPLRQCLAEEVHARPHPDITPPMRGSHLCVVLDDGGGEAQKAHLRALCERFDVTPPGDGETHFTADFGEFSLKWELRTEACTYTVLCPCAFTEPFEGAPVELLPAEWRDDLPGEMLVGLHFAVEPQDTPSRTPDEIAALFAGNSVKGSAMLDGKALAWSDFRLHGDGFGRILVRDKGMLTRQVGRLVQRLLEVETYRMMALLAYPLTREVGPLITDAERRLASITTRLPRIEGVEEERSLLQELSVLAAEAAEISDRTNYRFSAARAYYALVQRRIQDLRENRIQGLQPFGQFIDRRLMPAMNTCTSMVERQKNLARRLSRTGELLRTRVDVAVESQNQKLLESMDQRARVQLRLQETVEGLSVVAISYYLVGLVLYAAKAVKTAGLPVKPELAAGIALPVILLLVWRGVRSIRKAVTKERAG